MSHPLPSNARKYSWCTTDFQRWLGNVENADNCGKLLLQKPHHCRIGSQMNSDTSGRVFETAPVSTGESFAQRLCAIRNRQRSKDCCQITLVVTIRVSATLRGIVVVSIYHRKAISLSPNLLKRTLPSLAHALVHIASTPLQLTDEC